MSAPKVRHTFGRVWCTAVLLAGLCLPAAGQQVPPAPQTAASPSPATQPAEPPAPTNEPDLATATQPAATQPTEPPASRPDEFAPPPRRKDILHLDYLDADTELGTRYDWVHARFPVQNAYSQPTHQNQTARLWQIDETLGLRLAGDVVDPKWFTYNMALRLGLDQDIAHETSPTDNLGYGHNGWLTEYNFNFGLLQGKPLHFDVYTSREDGRLNRLFLPSLWHEAWRTGVTTFFESDRFPMELTLEQTRDTYSGDIDRYDDEDLKDNILRYGATARFTPDHQLRIDYQRDERHERYPGTHTTFDTTQNVLRLDDRLQFGPQHQHLWENTLEYEEDTGDLPRNHIYLGSRVALQHSQQLTTEYKYEYSRDSYGDTTQDTRTFGKSQDITFDDNRFDWITSWRPTDWLTGTGDLFAAHDTSDQGLDSNLFGGLARFSGNRDNRYGTLSGTVGYEYDYLDTDFGDNTGTQVNETVTFRNSAPQFLSHSDVQTGTILVTDLNRRELYLLGKDYIFIESGKYTALVRIPFGRIQENQAVRVTYRYRTIRSGRFQTHQFDARIQQDFKSGWTPYYEVLLRRQSIITSDAFFIEPNNVNRQRVGLTYHRKTWLVGGEAEFNDETIDPYNALHFNGSWTVLQRTIDQLAVRAQVSKFWYRNLEQREPVVFDVGFDYNRSLTNRLSATANVLYRCEHDSVLGNTNGVDAKAGVAYKIGELTISADVEYDMLDISDYGEDGVSLWIKVRRDFPNLLGKQR